MKNTSSALTSGTVLGTVVVLLGLVLTLGNFDVIDASSYLRYWPVLLVIFGVIKALQPGGSGGRFFGGLIAFVGAFMLLNRMDVINMNLWSFWPLLLVAAGASMILKHRGAPTADIDAEEQDTVGGMAVLGGLQQRISSRSFRGGSVSAIMGGHEIDLRDADMPDGQKAVLDIFALMGGVEVRVPEDWTIVIEGNAFLGGYENKARGSVSVRKHLVIRGQAIMGGVEIRN